MYLVTAVIKRHKLARVRDALPNCDIVGMTASEVRGFGRQRGHVTCGSYVEEDFDYLPKIKIEIAIEDQDLDRCVDAICKAAREGKVGDGKIFVTRLDDVIRVRTGESGPKAVAAKALDHNRALEIA